MKFHRRLFLGTAFSVTLLSLSPVNASAATAHSPSEPWKLVIDANYPPYQWKAADGSYHGIELEITEAAFKGAGVKYEIIVTPLERGFEMVKRGDKVACVGIYRKKERLEFSIIDLPLFTAANPLVVVNTTKATKLKGSPKFQEFVKSGLTIGLVDKYSYTDWADNYLKDLTEKDNVARMPADGIDALQNLVAKGRYDSTISYPEVYKWWADNHPTEAKNTKVVKFSDAPKESDSSYVMFPKNTDSKELKKILDSGMAFRKTAEYKAMMKKYMGE